LGSNDEVSAVDPVSVSPPLICEDPKITLFKPTVSIKRLGSNSPFGYKKARGRGRKPGCPKGIPCTITKSDEIIPVPESFKNVSTIVECVPKTLKVKFDLRGEGGKIVSILPVDKECDPIVGGAPSDPVITFDPVSTQFDFGDDALPDLGFGQGINGSTPTDDMLYKSI
jgi:hypothetical protein